MDGHNQPRAGHSADAGAVAAHSGGARAGAGHGTRLAAAHPPVETEPGGCLPLSPRLSFAARYRAKRASISAGFDALALAIVLTSARRHTSKAPIPPASLAYLLTLGGMAAANVLAYLAGGRARAAYVRCLEATAAIMRLQLFGLAFGGAGWELTRRLLDDPPAPASAVASGWLLAAVQGAGHTMLLLFASGAAPILHATLCRPMRLWLSAATQAALVAHSMSWAGHMCTAQQLAAPAAVAHTRALFARLASLDHIPLLPVLGADGPEAPPDVAQCATLLRFLQLGSGLAGLVWQAAAQAQLHGAHQRQRREAGLPPECGVSAYLYRAVADFFEDPVVAPQRWILAALSVGLCWQLALGVSLKAPPP